MLLWPDGNTQLLIENPPSTSNWNSQSSIWALLSSCSVKSTRYLTQNVIKIVSFLIKCSQAHLATFSKSGLGVSVKLSLLSLGYDINNNIIATIRR